MSDVGDREATGPELRISGTPGFAAWLQTVGMSLVVTTYQAGKILFVGVSSGGRLSVFERTFRRCMGVGVGRGNRLWLSTLFQLWRFENFLDPGQIFDDHDVLMVPVASHTTGELDGHDVCVDKDQQPIFVATRFSCLATIAERGSFRPLWRPDFITDLVPEDRCHLNGLAMEEGRPAYVTAVAATNEPGGWRALRADGGVVLSVEESAEVAGGLSMPHSPRMHDGQLWLLQSGTGMFGRVDLGTGQFDEVCRAPGFARGLALFGPYAVIGVSKARREDAMAGLPVKDWLSAQRIAPVCQLLIVDLRSGEIIHRLSIEGAVEELYDVAVLPGVRRPMALGLQSDDIQRMVRPEY